MTCERPHVGIGVFIKNKEGKILMLLRKGSHGAGTWSLPGGKLEHGESWEACAQREVKEETGLDINNVTYVTATNDIHEEGLHYTTIFVEAKEHEGEASIEEPEKCLAMQWYDWENLPANLFLNVKILKEQGFSP